MRSFDFSWDDANELFGHVKRMLWLCNEMEYDGLREQNRQFSIDQSLLVLDEMWHNFILFTTDYRKFCFEHFGYFIDHLPTIESDEEKARRAEEFDGLNREQRIAKVMEEKRWQYTYVLQKLGREVFLKWYTEYHETYTARHLLELKLRKLDAATMPDAATTIKE